MLGCQPCFAQLPTVRLLTGFVLNWIYPQPFALPLEEPDACGSILRGKFGCNKTQTYYLIHVQWFLRPDYWFLFYSASTLYLYFKSIEHGQFAFT
jgi:hypothetical protein